MRQIFCLISVLSLFLDLNAKSQTHRPISVSTLCIGNEHYKSNPAFKSISGLANSASKVLNVLKPMSDTPCILVSKNNQYLTKAKITSAVKSFVDYVSRKKDDYNLGIIYYVGHGITTLNGSAYIVPGDISLNLSDRTFEDISNNLINIDTLKQIIMSMQDDSSKSHFILIMDCCADKITSRIYNGITYSARGDSMKIITYDSLALRKMLGINSSLAASAGLIDSLSNFDTTGNIFTNEIPNVGEWIRNLTFQDNNLIVYSSGMGEKTKVSTDPYNPSNPMGPLGRRTILYFKKIQKTIDDWLIRLADPQFDPSTKPALLYRSAF